MTGIDTFLDIVHWIESEPIARVKNLLEQKYGSKFGSAPHFTIVLLPMPFDKLPEVDAILTKYFAKMQSFSVGYSDITFDTKNRFFRIEVEPSILKKMHLELLELLNHLRGNAIRQKDVERVASNYFDALQLEVVNKYGYSRSERFFHAHITLGDIADDSIDSHIVRQEIDELINGADIGETEVKAFDAELWDDKDDQLENELLWKRTYKLA